MTRACVPCAQCGRQDLPAESRFCLACGAAVGGGARAEAYTPAHLARDVFGIGSARAGERKDVTVLLADVAGSLSLAQALDPEETHEVMDGLFALAGEAVHAQQGTINQFRGDGFMALFGAPRAHGEDALRALRAALRLRERLPAYAESVRARFGLPLLLRMGVSTGTVWVGSIGSELRLDYTAEGPTVGLAARLESEAQSGQILLDEETARRARPFFALRDLGARPLRGVHEDVRIYELVGPGAHEARLDAESARGLTPFVGRVGALSLLERAWARASLGRLTLVELGGEAGIGKSRLLLEHQRRSGTSALEVRCRETDARRALAPWLPVLRAWPADRGNADAAQRIATVLAGEDDAPATSPVDAVVDLVREASCTGPLLLVVEDAQWIDPSTQRVIERLALHAAESPILVVLTTRTERTLEGLGALTERLWLGPLEAGEDSAIARAILGDGDEAEALVALAVQRASGNPLFLEEVARALREAPEPVRRTARLEAQLHAAPHRVPSTLHGVIAARIDALPDASKRLLEAAAIALGPVSSALMAEVETAIGDEIEPAFADLVRRDLVAQLGDGRWDVRHALVRDVAYAQVLRQRRVALHLRCARAFEKDAAGDGAAGHSRVGTHYDLADELAPAARYLGRAGEGYLLLHAHAESIAHLRRAWEIHCGASTLDPDERCAVGAALASALNMLDRSAEAGAVLGALESEGLRPSDRVRVGRVYVQSGWVAFSSQHDLARGRSLLERGTALLADTPEGRHDEAVAHAYLSRIYHVDGEIARAVASARRVAELAAAGGNRFGIAMGRAYEGAALCDGGDVEPGCAACEESSALAGELQNEVAVALSSAFLARALGFRGDTAGAIQAARRAIQAADRTGQLAAKHIAAIALGLAHLLDGEPARAAAAFDRLADAKDPWDSALDFRARGRLELGRYDDAVELARACLERDPPRLVRARTLCTLGLALGLRGGVGAGDAEGVIAESISLCEELGLRPHLAEAHAALAELCLQRGDADRAAYFRERSVAGFEACGMRVHAQRLRATEGRQPSARSR